MQSRKTGKKFMGSMTVEASYISVIVVLIIVLLLYIGFYFHDRSTVKSYAVYLSQLMTKSSLKWLDINTNQIDREEEFSHILNDLWSLAYNANRENLENKGYELIRNKMLFCNIERIHIECDYDQLFDRLRCSVYVYGYLDFPVSLFGYPGIKFTERSEAKEIDAVKAIWKKEAVINGGSPDDG